MKVMLGLPALSYSDHDLRGTANNENGTIPPPAAGRSNPGPSAALWAHKGLNRSAAGGFAVGIF